MQNTPYFCLILHNTTNDNEIRMPMHNIYMFIVDKKKIVYIVYLFLNHANLFNLSKTWVFTFFDIFTTSSLTLL